MGDSVRAGTFGTLLKKLRLEEAEIGLRAFAELIDWQPSDLSNLERGRARAPADRQTISEICDALGLAEHNERRTQLFDLAAQERNADPGDVVEATKRQPGIPVLVRAVANKRLEEGKLDELAEYIKTFY